MTSNNTKGEMTILLNISQRHFSRNLFLYLLFLIVFTVGFIIGVLYSPSLNAETFIKPDISLETRLKNNFSYLLVAIFSSPENFERRQAIRRSWLMTKGNNSIQHYFALGVHSLNSNSLTSLKNEHNTFGDLLFLYSFTDSYSRLSEKLREVFKWCYKNRQYSFLLKVDDDSFVQLNILFNTLIKLPQEKLYWGFFDGQAVVKTRGKWKEKNWFLCDRYLPYAKGGGYVVSRDVVNLIVSVSDHLSLYENEDVSLGTWLSPFQVHRIHDPNFDTEYRSRGCLNSFIVTHKQTESSMKQKYQNLINTGNLCLKEHAVRSAYIYNWNVPPSQCCSRGIL